MKFLLLFGLITVCAATLPNCINEIPRHEVSVPNFILNENSTLTFRNQGFDAMNYSVSVRHTSTLYWILVQILALNNDFPLIYDDSPFPAGSLNHLNPNMTYIFEITNYGYDFPLFISIDVEYACV